MNNRTSCCVNASFLFDTDKIMGKAKKHSAKWKKHSSQCGYYNDLEYFRGRCCVLDLKGLGGTILSALKVLLKLAT